VNRLVGGAEHSAGDEEPRAEGGTGRGGHAHVRGAGGNGQQRDGADGGRRSRDALLRHGIAGCSARNQRQRRKHLRR